MSLGPFSKASRLCKPPYTTEQGTPLLPASQRRAAARKKVCDAFAIFPGKKEELLDEIDRTKIEGKDINLEQWYAKIDAIQKQYSDVKKRERKEQEDKEVNEVIEGTKALVALEEKAKLPRVPLTPPVGKAGKRRKTKKSKKKARRTKKRFHS